MIYPLQEDQAESTMTPPPSMLCSAPGCTFETPPSIPTYEYVMKSLELHVQSAHSSPTRLNATKTEKPKRPVLTSNMSESDWFFFQHKWTRYKRLSQIQGQALVDELWACLDPDIERLAFQDGINETDPDNLLTAIKQLAVTTIHPSLHVITLHEAKQSSEENVKSFSARVHGIAKNCELTKRCTKQGCSEQVSFLEETCYHTEITGILYDDLRQKILTQAMIGTVKDLPTLLEFATAEEASKQKTPIRSVAAIQRSKQTQNKKCIGCGLESHGPFNKKRPSECKAYGKKCNKCGRLNHYTSVCKSGSTAAAVVNVDPTTDEDQTPSISGFITAVQATPLRDLDSARIAVAALKADSPSKVNILPVPHFVYDKQVKSWVKRAPKASTTIDVSVDLDRAAYKELGLNLPDLVQKPSAGHARNRKGTLDSGAQLTIANEMELVALGIKKSSIFPLATTVHTVTKANIDLVGGVFLKFSMYDHSAQITRCTRQLCYISKSIKGIYLSEEACLALGFIKKDFGQPAPSIGSLETNKCVNTGVGPDGSQICACPRRELPPPEIPDLPCDPTRENVSLLKKFFMDKFASSAFNTCEKQVLPLMDTSPPLKTICGSPSRTKSSYESLHNSYTLG